MYIKPVNISASLILILFFLAFNGYSQEIDFKITEEEQSIKHVFPIDILIKSNDEFIQYSDHNDKAFSFSSIINTISKDLKIGEKHPIKAPFDNCTPSRMIQLKDKLYLFALRKYKKERKVEWLVVELDENGEILTSKTLGSNSYNAYKDMPVQTVIISKDSSHIALINTFDEDKKKNTFASYLNVFDKDLNPVSEFYFDEGQTQKVQNLDFPELANDGTLYWMTETFKNKGAKMEKDGKPSYDIHLHKLTADGSHSKVALDNKSKFIRSYRFGIGNDENIYAISSYSEKKNSNVMGIITYKFSKDGLTLVTDDLHEFTSKEITDFADYGKKKGLKEENIFINSTLIYEDRVAFFLEANYFKFNKNSGYKYFTGSLLKFEVGTNGKLINSSHIHKKSAYAMPLYQGSHVEILNGKEFYFFSNDKDNLENDKYKDLKSSSFKYDEYAMVYFYNESGKLEYKVLKEDDKYMLVPDMCRKISENQVLMVFYKATFKTRYKYGIMTVN